MLQVAASEFTVMPRSSGLMSWQAGFSIVGPGVGVDEVGAPVGLGVGTDEAGALVGISVGVVVGFEEAG